MRSDHLKPQSLDISTLGTLGSFFHEHTGQHMIYKNILILRVYHFLFSLNIYQWLQFSVTTFNHHIVFYYKVIPRYIQQTPVMTHMGCFQAFVLDKGHPQPQCDQKILWPHKTNKTVSVCLCTRWRDGKCKATLLSHYSCSMKLWFNNKMRPGRWSEALPDNLSMTARAHVVREREPTSWAVLWPPHTHCVCPYPWTQTHKVNKYSFKK